MEKKVRQLIILLAPRARSHGRRTLNFGRLHRDGHCGGSRVLFGIALNGYFDALAGGVKTALGLPKRTVADRRIWRAP